MQASIADARERAAGGAAPRPAASSARSLRPRRRKCNEGGDCLEASAAPSPSTPRSPRKRRPATRCSCSRGRRRRADAARAAARDRQGPAALVHARRQHGDVAGSDPVERSAGRRRRAHQQERQRRSAAGRPPGRRPPASRRARRTSRCASPASSASPSLNPRGGCAPIEARMSAGPERAVAAFEALESPPAAREVALALERMEALGVDANTGAPS